MLNNNSAFSVETKFNEKVHGIEKTFEEWMIEPEICKTKLN